MERNKSEIIEYCPHCGHRLSPWQQVLLSVDRALTCKNCWYKIILDVPIKANEQKKSSELKTKHKG